MPNLSDIFQHGAGNAWLFIPSAIVLGALHGLEPGHSKTMMAAFIIAVRGTVTQAVQLGVSAALSHTAVVWAVALVGLSYGSRFNADTSEPYFQVASAAAIVAIALWMLWRSWWDLRRGDAHDHHHHDDIKRIDTGRGIVTLSIFEDGAPPRFRLQLERDGPLDAAAVALETMRPDGRRQTFAFAKRGDFWESTQDIPEPHAFDVNLVLGAAGQSRSYVVAFAEHDHNHAGDDAEAMDAHARAHAHAIEANFKGRTVTTRQIILFGLTGGLIPCPAAITVLLVCLQVKQVSLGFTLVLAFSLGLAITMVTAGVLAALSLKHVSTRWSGFGTAIRYAPLVSSGLVLLMGLYLGQLGWSRIA